MSSVLEQHHCGVRLRLVPSKLAMVRGLAASDHLDMVRGIAALLVVFGHARVLFLASVEAGAELNVVDRCLYLLSGLGHQAVIVFFVLSGFFISSSVLRDIERQQWSWSRYLTNRGTRLFIVLVPCLLLTAFWDRLGNVLVDLTLTAGSDTGVANISREGIEANSSIAILVGNLLFLQTILVPTFGSNTPLWSLSYEFWYYVLFPCALFALLPSRNWPQRVCLGILSVCILCFVGPTIATYFLIWLLGTVVCVLPPMALLESRRNTLVGLAVCSFALLLVLLAVVLKRVEPGTTIDIITASVFCFWMFFILHLRGASRQNLYARFARQLSGFSFSLYALHMPLLIFLRELLTRQSGWKAGLMSWFALSLILALVVIYAYLVAWLTERQTYQIRRWLDKRLWRA